MSVLPFANLDGHLRDRVMTDIPCMVTWKGGAYQGVRSTPDDTQNLIVGGVEEIIAYQVFFRRAIMPQDPKVGDLMLIDGTTKMRVLGVRISPDAALVTCMLGFSKER